MDNERLLRSLETGASGLDEDELVEPVEEKPESVDEYLDREDLNRMEWDRLNDDLHPHQTPDDETRPIGPHKDTDAVQVWMREQRRDG